MPLLCCDAEVKAHRSVVVGGRAAYAVSSAVSQERERPTCGVLSLRARRGKQHGSSRSWKASCGAYYDYPSRGRSAPRRPPRAYVFAFGGPNGSGGKDAQEPGRATQHLYSHRPYELWFYLETSATSDTFVCAPSYGTSPVTVHCPVSHGPWFGVFCCVREAAVRFRLARIQRSTACSTAPLYALLKRGYDTDRMQEVERLRHKRRCPPLSVTLRMQSGMCTQVNMRVPDADRYTIPIREEVSPASVYSTHIQTSAFEVGLKVACCARVDCESFFGILREDLRLEFEALAGEGKHLRGEILSHEFRW
ncbi:unnamed protein product [Rangifer tarandus platyrhynchus]|uniref:Uncharacterized protein n=1 Tax=Rangifer tarandus platyrhynchus TaxID=3082113 RepID=A0ACB1KEJ2_RANTA